MKLNKKSILLPILFMGLIIFLATISEGKLIDVLKHRFSYLISIKSRIQDFLRIEVTLSQVQNFLHVPFFAVLSFLWMEFFKRRNVELKKAIIYTLIITIFFAGFEEFLQHFVPDRDASFLDLLSNCFGILIGIIVFKALNQVKPRNV